jgi:hypothetical protein
LIEELFAMRIINSDEWGFLQKMIEKNVPKLSIKRDYYWPQGLTEPRVKYLKSLLIKIK